LIWTNASALFMLHEDISELALLADANPPVRLRSDFGLTMNPG
jgi:hypothetical protein